MGSLITRNFRFGSQQPHTIYPTRESRALFSLWGWPPVSAQGPHGPTQVPKLMTTAFPSGLVRHPSVPPWLWIDLSATASAIPPEATAPRSAAPYSQTEAFASRTWRFWDHNGQAALKREALRVFWQYRCVRTWDDVSELRLLTTSLPESMSTNVPESSQRPWSSIPHRRREQMS
jgi:hypothetical protein